MIYASTTPSRFCGAAGAQVLVLGCTELPIAVDSASTAIPVVDATDVLARACLQWAGGTVRP